MFFLHILILYHLLEEVIFTLYYLYTTTMTLLLVHPFVIILKPAVAMSAQPDSTVALVALVETLLFLAVGLWLAKYRRYE